MQAMQPPASSPSPRIRLPRLNWSVPVSGRLRTAASETGQEGQQGQPEAGQAADEAPRRCGPPAGSPRLPRAAQDATSSISGADAATSVPTRVHSATLTASLSATADTTADTAMGSNAADAANVMPGADCRAVGGMSEVGEVNGAEVVDGAASSEQLGRLQAASASAHGGIGGRSQNGAGVRLLVGAAPAPPVPTAPPAPPVPPAPPMALVGLVALGGKGSKVEALDGPGHGAWHEAKLV